MRRHRSARTLPALFLALASAACAAPGAGPLFPTPGRDRAELSDPEIDAIAEALMLEDHRRWDEAAFRRLAGSSSVEVRRRAVTAAGRIGDRRASPFLLGVLAGDPSPAVRADAAFALGELGDTSAAVIRGLDDAAPSSWVPVRDEEGPVVVEALGALGRLGTPAAGRLVADALLELHPILVRKMLPLSAEALLAAWRFGESTPVSRIVPFLRVPHPEIRWRAAYALSRSARPEGVPPLLGAFEDEDHRVRAYAARALSRPQADRAGVADSALALLTAALADGHPHVRINAAGALGSWGDRAPLDALRARVALESGRPDVAIAILQAMGRLGARAAEPLRLLASDPILAPGVRGAALAQLAPLDPAAAAGIARSWVDQPFEPRWLAARALAPLGWPLARDILQTLASDDDPRVAIAALESAGAMAADSALTIAARAGLRALLSDRALAPDPRVAAAARAGLEPADTPDDAPGQDPAVFSRDVAAYRDAVRRWIAPVLAGEDRPRAIVRTAAGSFEIELLAEEAPLTVANFVRLAGLGYFDGGVWHRVVPNFVLQDGAPAGHSSGGPGWRIRDEINRVRYERGVLGMALSGPDTGGSQWFITHSPQPHLDGGYTIFGRVVRGMDVADRVLQGDPILSITVR